DAVYGRDSGLRASLDKEQIAYVVDVPHDYPVYTQRPVVGVPPASNSPGRKATKPRVLNGVESVPASSLLDKTVTWLTLQLRYGERGAIEVTCWARRVWTITNKWEVREEWLVVHRQGNAKIQQSLSNATTDTPLQTIMQWRGQRYFVE